MKKIKTDIINKILTNGLIDLGKLGYCTAQNFSGLFLNHPAPFGTNDSSLASATGKSSGKLPIVEYENYIITKSDLMNAFIQIKSVIVSLKGTVIYENANGEDAYIVAKIGSGFMNLNPTVICVDFNNLENENKICIAAYAKEGLIKQNSSQKAFDMVKQQLWRSFGPEA